mgnify:CR=1 FL=1
MTSFDPKKITYGKDDPINYSSIESKRSKVVANIERWLQYLGGKLQGDTAGKKVVAPAWLSRAEGDKRHFRLKYAQRNIAIGPKGEDRLTVNSSVNVIEVFGFLREQVLNGKYDQSIEAITNSIKQGYSTKADPS